MSSTPRPNLSDLWPPPHVGSHSPPSAESGAERAILRCAIEMFGRHGYGSTSTRSIAAAASVTAPLIGYHFGSKEGLFRECVDVVVGGIVTAALEVCREDLPFEEMVRRFAEIHIHAAQSYPHALRFALSIAYGPEEGQPEIDLFGLWQPILLALAERMRRAIEEGEFVPRPGASLQGLVQQLVHTVHFEVFAIHERERFGKQAVGALDFGSPADDPVGDVVAQFFHGAGTLVRGLTSVQEDR